MAKMYRRAEVEELLKALESNANAVVNAARVATADTRHDKFEAYTAFRERCDDFDTLAILIEHRLKNIAGGRAEDLETKFNELKVFMLSSTLKTSLHFLRVLSEQDSLPLGSRDIFLRELRNLHSVNSKIATQHHAVEPSTLNDMRLAEEILGLILDRAPALLNLDQREAASA